MAVNSKEILEAFAKQNGVDHKRLMGAVTKYIDVLTAEVIALQLKALPSPVRETIQAFNGVIKYVQERLNNKGYFVVVDIKDTGFNVITVDKNEPDSYSLRANLVDFPELEQAVSYVHKLVANDLPQKPEHHELSELKVLEATGEGFYVGREWYDSHCGEWIPASRITRATGTRLEAEEMLEHVLEVRTHIARQSVGNLKSLAISFFEQIPENPMNEIRLNIVMDELRANRKVKPHVLHELSRKFAIKKTGNGPIQ